MEINGKLSINFALAVVLTHELTLENYVRKKWF
jgi:hypothetical protein